MKAPLLPVLFWLPRGLAILFAGFISLFALDVFSEARGLRDTLMALLIHLIPTGLLLLALAIAWRWEGAGALLFIGLALIYVIGVDARMDWPAYLFIAGPLFLIGGLFLVDQHYRTRLAIRS
jgi:hypothetical protein